MSKKIKYSTQHYISIAGYFFSQLDNVITTYIATGKGNQPPQYSIKTGYGKLYVHITIYGMSSIF